jgi:hypothetical protein
VTDELQPLFQALARVRGALSEVGTVWRRAHAERPDIPLDLPLRLADDARRLTGLRGRGGPGGITGQLAALDRDIAAAAALTCNPGLSPVGDAGLWDYVRAALDEARGYALTLDHLPLAS